MIEAWNVSFFDAKFAHLTIVYISESSSSFHSLLPNQTTITNKKKLEKCVFTWRIPNIMLAHSMYAQWLFFLGVYLYMYIYERLYSRPWIPLAIPFSYLFVWFWIILYFVFLSFFFFCNHIYNIATFTVWRAFILNPLVSIS